MTDKKAREIVVDILQKIELEEAYSNIALKQTLDSYKGLILKDKGLITEITNGTIKYTRKIDYIINQFSNTPTHKMKPVIRYTLRMSVYQIIFLDKIPNSAVCNEAVEIVKKRKMGRLSGFVNGVLRNIIRQLDTVNYPNKSTHPVEYLGIMYSFPDWIIALWLENYSYDFVEALCQSMNQSPDLKSRWWVYPPRPGCYTLALYPGGWSSGPPWRGPWPSSWTISPSPAWPRPPPCSVRPCWPSRSSAAP